MRFLSKAQRLVQDLRSLNKIKNRVEELSDNWIDVDFTNQDTLCQLHQRIAEVINEWEELLQEEKANVKEYSHDNE